MMPQSVRSLEFKNTEDKKKEKRLLLAMWLSLDSK